jgi:type II secretory pathway component PulF
MSAHKTLANWYNQLGQQLEAGLSLPEAVLLCEGPPLKGRQALHKSLVNGDSIEIAFAKTHKWLPAADRIFISAAAETGRIPQTFLSLAARHVRIAETQSRILLSLIYPIGVIHVAALALPLMSMIDFETGLQWDLALYIQLALSLLIPLWGIIGVLVFMSRIDSPLIPRLLRSIPILRKYKYFQTIADFSESLAVFVETGIPIQSAWAHAVEIASDPRIQKAYNKLLPTFAAGQDPSSRLQESSVFPSDLVALYRSGARSGQLDKTLKHASRQYQEKANNSLKLAAMVYPSLCFAVAAGIVALMVYKLYGGYLDSIMEMIDQ